MGLLNQFLGALPQYDGELVNFGTPNVHLSPEQLAAHYGGWGLGEAANVNLGEGGSSVDRIRDINTGQQMMTLNNGAFSKPGDSYYTGYMNADGSFDGRRNVITDGILKPGDFKDLATAAAVMAAGYGAGAGLGYLGAGSAGGIGGSGFAAGGAGLEGAGSTLAAAAPNTAVMGAGPAPIMGSPGGVQFGVIDAAYANPNALVIGSGTGAAAGGAAGAAAGGGSGAGAGSGEVLSKAALDGTTSFGANSVPGAYEIGAGGGVTSGLLNTAAKYAPGIVSGILSGFSKPAGAYGSRELDPRVAAYIFGDDKQKGGLAFAQGLLNAPVAPNAFERFYGKKG